MGNGHHGKGADNLRASALKCVVESVEWERESEGSRQRRRVNG
jgi:hypothetical protein